MANIDRRFWLAYEQWLDDCLAEFNARYGEARKYHTAPAEYDPGELVEFSDDGGAYLHGIGGTSFIPHVVTPWAESPHYVDWRAA